MNGPNAQNALLQFGLTYASDAALQVSRVSTDALVAAAFLLLLTARLLICNLRAHHQTAYRLAAVVFVARLAVGLFMPEQMNLLSLVVRSGLLAAIMYGATRTFLGSSVLLSRVTEPLFDSPRMSEVLPSQTPCDLHQPPVNMDEASSLTGDFKRTNYAHRSVHTSDDDSQPLRTVYSETVPLSSLGSSVIRSAEVMDERIPPHASSARSSDEQAMS